eukprot:m.424003 g.424003  ORF g.424003 m.424003 type:complete len:165 (+) comp21335_c0_seq9:327-821(+)
MDEKLPCCQHLYLSSTTTVECSCSGSPSEVTWMRDEAYRKYNQTQPTRDDLECLVAHRDFLAAFKVQVMFHEFLEQCSMLFSECQSTNVTLEADGRGNIVRTDAFLVRLEQLKLPPDVAAIPLEIAASAVAGMTESVTVNDIFLSFIRSQAVINLADSPQTGGY